MDQRPAPTAPDTPPPAAQPPSGPSLTDEPKDLGFGSVVGREHEQRLLNRDGTFNVGRQHLRFWESLSVYHSALSMSWPSFVAVLMGLYVTLNALFAVSTGSRRTCTH